MTHALTRSWISILCSVLLTVLCAPAQGLAKGEIEETRVSFSTLAPCTPACPYVPLVFVDIVGSSLSGEHVRTSESAMCHNPPSAVPGSVDDIRLVVPPTVDVEPTRYLRLGIRPRQWSDAAICFVENPGALAETYRFGAWASPKPDCAGHGLLGYEYCYDEAIARVDVGDVVVLRLINVLDDFVVAGSYAWCSFDCETRPLSI